ncbi:MAG: hypothetical protein C4346_14120 [Chloroflexota bacterium]
MSAARGLGASHPLTFGVVTGQHQLTWPQLREQWQMAEALGFDSVWVFDHFLPLYGDPDGPCLEASTLLAALALTTTRVRIGVLVYGNTHRNPAILAKEIVTVDHFSGGAQYWASVRPGTSASTAPTASRFLRQATAWRCSMRR